MSALEQVLSSCESTYLQFRGRDGTKPDQQSCGRLPSCERRGIGLATEPEESNEGYCIAYKVMIMPQVTVIEPSPAYARAFVSAPGKTSTTRASRTDTWLHLLHYGICRHLG